MHDQHPLKPFVDLLFTEIHIFPQSQKKAQQLTRARQPGTFSLEGRISAGTVTTFAVDGHDFMLCADTWVVGVLRHGVYAKVKGQLKNGKDRIATAVSVAGASS